MYVKLSLRNMKRSAKDYLIYLVTLILCVALFYAFMSISSTYYKASLPVEASLDAFNIYMKYAVFFISAILLFLIKYVNSFMMKRKKKEFAIQTMMGMEQRTTAYLFFVETLFMGLLAIGLGVLLGALFSQAITAIILSYFEQTYEIYFSLFPDTILITLLFFICSFCLIGFFNVLTIRKIKVIDMLTDNKKTENLKAAKPIFVTIIGILSGMSVIVCIICLINQVYYLQTVLLLIFSIYGFYHCLSALILLIKNKSAKIKYANDNLFFFGQITSKLKTTSKTMTTITISLMSSIIILVMATVMSAWAMGYLELRAVFDVQLFSGYYGVENLESINQVDYSFIINYLKENGQEIENYTQTELFFLNPEDSNNKSGNTNEPTILGISLSDYNMLRKMTGLEDIVLDENTFTTQWYKSTMPEVVNDFLGNHETIIIGNKTLQLSSVGFYKDSYGEMLYSSAADLVYVLPDEVCHDLDTAGLNFYVNTTNKLSVDFAIELEEYAVDYIKASQDLTENHIGIRVKTLQYNSGISGSLMTLFLLSYGGVVLIIMCFTVLSLQQLSDSDEQKYRFNVLIKMGVDSFAAKKLLLKQMGIWFGVPVILSFSGSAIILSLIIDFVKEPVLAFVGANQLFYNIAGTYLIILVILFCYFTSAMCCQGILKSMGFD